MSKTVGTASRLRYGTGGGVYNIVATAQETNGAIFAFEAIEPPGGGPPLHTHAAEEEFFWVLEGEMSFWIGGRVTRVPAGGTAFVPRGVPHCFRNCTTSQVRALLLFTPGSIEGLFDYGEPLPDGSAPSEEVLHARLVELGRKYGLEVLGPSPL